MSAPPIDLRSDTVTQPTAGMRDAMLSAAVGDDVFGEDPTINALQDRMASLTGKDAALFVPSGTMANQIAIASHTRPGMEIILEADSHSFHFESAAASMIAGVQLRPIAGDMGILTPAAIAAAIRPAADHYPETGLIQIENTHNLAGGTVYPLETLRSIRALAEDRHLAVHLDGARLWNASVASGVSLADYGACVDSLSLCFSKGLGAPVGSILVGNREFITRAHRMRKAFGGGMRQAGMLAAAAIYALDHHIERLAEDHTNAHTLAAGLAGLPGLHIAVDAVATNIVMGLLDTTCAAAWQAAAQNRGVLFFALGDCRVRWVTHLDVGAAAVQQAIGVLRETYPGVKKNK